VIKRLYRALRREKVRAISRRYLISNGFDGTLTSIGLAVGSYLSGMEAGITVFKIGVGAAVGLTTSGIWSVLEIERAEKKADLHRIEKAMLSKLENTNFYRNKKDAIIVNALMSGLGPLIGIILPVTPFLFVPGITMLQATLSSVIIGTMLLSTFGAYMANISEQNWVWAGIRMGLAGIVVAALNVALPG